MARLGDQNPRATHLTFTMCPGTDVYMPPEAVKDKPTYTEKIDCFSFGVVIIQILTQLFPKPGDRIKEVEISYPGQPSRTLMDYVPEVNRRRNHIAKVDPNHLLLPISLHCLKDKDVERPSAHQLCEKVTTLKESPEYHESVRVAKEKGTSEQGRRDRELRSLRQQHAQQVQCLQQVVRQKDQTIAQLRQEVREKSHVIEDNERQLGHANQQLEESEKVNARFQRRISELEQLRPATDMISKTKQQSSSRDSIKLIWREERRAPFSDSSDGYNGSVVSGTLYVRLGNKKVYGYDSTWSRLPDSPYIDCPSVIINNLFTLIGGQKGATITNQLFSLTGEGSGRKWTKKFPPMPTKRRGTSVLCTGTALIVAGGMDDQGHDLKVVEVMNIEGRLRSTAADLPEPQWCVPAAVCGDQVYILTKNSMYTCSGSALIRSCRSKVTADLWDKVVAPPVTCATCMSIHGQLLTIGGRDSKLNPTTAIHMYHPTTNSWQVISHMTKPRYNSFAGVLPNNQLVVVGGYTGGYLKTDSVELATVE